MKKNFFQQIQSVLEKLDTKYLYMILGGSLLVLFLLTYWILIRPQLAEIAKVSSQIKVLSGNLQRTKNDIQRLSQYQQEAARIKKEIEQANQKVRTKEDVPLILERISRLATKNGIKIDQVTPDPQEEEDLLTQENLRYFILPISLDARSGYHNFGRFLNALERQKISLTIHHFRIAATPDTQNHAVKIILHSTLVEEIQAKNGAKP